MSESNESSQKTLAEYFREEKIRSMTIGSNSAGCSVQFVRSLAALDHEKSDYWCKVNDAEKVLTMIENVNPGGKLTVEVVAACLERRVLHKCLKS